MSAILSTLPPPSSRPGLAKAYPSLSENYATPRQLKAEAIRLQGLCGMSKRATAEAFGRPWETVRGWLDPRALDRTPPTQFVKFLTHKVDALRSESLALEASWR